MVSPNNLNSGSTNASKASRQTAVRSDDTDISPRNAEEISHLAVREILDSRGADEATDYARIHILTDSNTALLVQANLNPQHVLDLLAE